MRSYEGQVCITASDGMSSYHLPRVLERLREMAPEIEVEILASNAIQDLRRREADIAIRHIRPEQPELIARLIRVTTAHLVASPTHLEQHGRPTGASDLSDASFIGFENPDRMISFLNTFGLALTRSNVKLVTNSGIAVWEMVKQGLGIGVMTRDLAAVTAGVEIILPDLVSIEVPIWLTTHRELHTSRRIRLVFDLLADALA